MSSGPPDEWGDLLLDGPLPDVGLLDDLQLGFGLMEPELPPGLEGLDCLGLDLGGGGAAAAAPSNSDLLESLQLDAAGFAHPQSSSGTRHSPSDSGSDSPVVLPLVGGGVPAPNGAPRGGAAPPVGGPLDGQASPATSESENNGRGRSGSPAVGSAQRGGTADGGAVGKPNRPLTDEEKRLARMQRNRENAQLSRQRKKQQMVDLEVRCKSLTQQNVQLTGAVQRLTAENAQLRQQLALVCTQAGVRSAGAAPGSSDSSAACSNAGSGSTGAGKAGEQAAAGAASQPAAQGAAAAKQVQRGAAPPAGTPVTMKGVLPQWPLLPFGLLPKVALAMQQQQQQQQGARPAAAPGPAAAARPAQQAAGPPAVSPAQPAARPAAAAPARTAPGAARPAKRAKTTAAAGASTAFLALFTLFMFAGPFTPGPQPSSPASTSLAGGAVPQRTLQALPELPRAVGAEEDGLHHGGRGLRALPLAASKAEAGALQRQPAPLPPLEGGHLHRLLNSTLQALLLEPGNEAVEAAALQRLQELGPVALLLDADGGPPGANPLAASAAFPGLAGQLFGAAGLEVPQMCTKVLEFDAASVPHAARSRRSLERYVLGATGFRGRSLAAVGPAGSSSGSSGPPADREPLRIELLGGGEPGGEEGGEEDGPGISTALLPAAPHSNASTLVSVLLPANASNDGMLTSIDKVFVVVLHPQDRYATYACSLPRPVFL